ncbi:MAG: CorA family divalent cation transporter [Dehalococcoidia bacterium]|nr:CorA family divalent cation transporter [Dehalococcoidia bacterium]
MADVGSNGKPDTVSVAPSEGYPKQWFCVSVATDGSIFKGDSESPHQFANMVNSSVIAWVDYWTDNFDRDAAVAASKFGFTDALVSSLAVESRTTYQDFDTEMGMRLPSVQVRGFQVEPYPLLILMRRTFILTVHPLNVDRRFHRMRRYADTFIRKIRQDLAPEDRLTLLLLRIIDETNERNFEHLRQVEVLGEALNKDMTDPNIPRQELGPKIYAMKHALITYLDALWETNDVLHALRYGDAELITDEPKLLYRLTLLAEDVNRQIGLAEHLSEVLASGLEVLQSIYNNQLQIMNNRMALIMTYLTVLGTAVLVPNTLATIMGSSAFNLQSNDIGWYVSMLVGSTILSTAIAYWWVKRSGRLPAKVD